MVWHFLSFNISNCRSPRTKLNIVIFFTSLIHLSVAFFVTFHNFHHSFYGRLLVGWKGSLSELKNSQNNSVVFFYRFTHFQWFLVYFFRKDFRILFASAFYLDISKLSDPRPLTRSSMLYFDCSFIDTTWHKYWAEKIYLSMIHFQLYFYYRLYLLFAHVHYSMWPKVLQHVKKSLYNQPNTYFFKKNLWSHFWIDFNKFYTKTFRIVYILIVDLLIMFIWVVFISS